MADVKPRALENDVWLCQVGKRMADGSYKFLGAPRPHRDPVERDLSLQLGRLPAGEARVKAYGTLTRLSPGKDAVRYVQAGALRSAGFRVEHTPYPQSPGHVSVFWDGDDGWDDRVEILLHACCSEGEVDG